MLSPFSCRIPYQPGTSFRVLELRPPIWVKRFGSWNCITDTRSRSKVDVARVHILRLMGNSHQQHPLCPPSDKRWYKDNSSLMLGTNNAPCNGGSPRPSASGKVMLNTMSENMNQMEPPGGPCSFPLIGLPAWALTLSIVFGGQPAYADFKPPVRPEVGVQMEVMSSSVPSVETILAKQLALRFRQMSDEELVDILQQLLKASRSSLSPQDTADDGMVPEDPVIKKDNGQLEMKTAERIRKELRGPETQESDANIDEKVRNREKYSGTQPADRQGKEGFDERIGGKTSFQEKANVQVDKKTLEKAKVTETQGQPLPMDRTPAENINGDARHSQTQKTKGDGNGAFTLPQTAEVIPGDASGISKSSESDLTGPTELPSRTPYLNTAEGSGEDENVTALLWAEWSRRASGEVVQNSQLSNTSFNVVDFWQNVQVYNTNVAREVVALTALVFDQYKVVVGIFTVWCILVVLAFQLGRSRASSRIDVSNSNEADIQEERYKASALPMKGEPRFKNDQLQDEKWWKRPSRGGFLSGTEQAPTQSIGSTFGQALPPGANGRLAQEVDYPSNTLRNRTRPELASFSGRGSDGVHGSSSQVEQSKEIQDGQEVFDGSKGPLYPSTSPVASLEIDSGEVQATGRQHQGQRQADQIDANVQDKREGYLAGEERHQGKTITSDRKGTSAASEHAFNSTSGGLNRDHRVATSPVEVVQDAEDTATDRNFEFQSDSATQIRIKHQKQADGHQENTPSRVFVQKGLGFNEQVNQADGLKGASAKQPGASNASWRGDKYAIANMSKPDLNSFVHDCVLFVRDADGVFIQQTDSKEDRDSSKVRDSSRVPQDIPDSLRAERSSWNAGSKDLQSPVSSKTLRKEAQNGFDYRLLVIDSSKKDQQQPGTATRESGTDGHAQQMWPLRYSSDGHKVLNE